MYKFQSYSKDEYSKLIDGLEADIFLKNKSHIREEDVGIKNFKFITEFDEVDVEVIHTVSPKTKKNSFTNTVVPR